MSFLVSSWLYVNLLHFLFQIPISSADADFERQNFGAILGLPETSSRDIPLDQIGDPELEAFPPEPLATEARPELSRASHNMATTGSSEDASRDESVHNGRSHVSALEEGSSHLERAIVPVGEVAPPLSSEAPPSLPSFPSELPPSEPPSALPSELSISEPLPGPSSNCYERTSRSPASPYHIFPR